MGRVDLAREKILPQGLAQNLLYCRTKYQTKTQRSNGSGYKERNGIKL